MPATQELQLERITSPEAGALLAAGYTTVVFSCGAVEQHGPHLPMFMDAEHGTVLAVGVARSLGNALVAPTVRVGCSEHHMAFPGTLSLEAETFEMVCRDYCRSLTRHGFTRICIIPSHGGNFAPLIAMRDRLQSAVGSEARVVVFTDLHAVMRVWTDAARTMGGGLETNVGGHADIAESSVMLVMHPELVHMDLAEAGTPGPPTQALMDRVFSEGFRAVTPNGILGDARGLSAELGRRCIDGLTAEMAGFFRDR